MFLFSKIHKNSIYKDLLKKINIKNYQNLQNQKGVFLELSFFLPCKDPVDGRGGGGLNLG